MAAAPHTVDYDSLAATYDEFRKGGGPFMPALVRLAQEAEAETVLELGAGTGNNTARFLELYPSAVVGLDASFGMLAQARRKGLSAFWVQSDSETLPFSDGAFGFVLGVQVAHHFHDLQRVLRECARVVDQGCVALVTSPHDFIERHPMNRYFPSFAKIDKDRFPSMERLQACFDGAGLGAWNYERNIGIPESVDSHYVDKVENQFISTYRLIPEDEFRRGLDQLKRDVAAGRGPAPFSWEAVTVWGWI